MNLIPDYTTLLLLLPASFIASAIVLIFVHIQHKEIPGTREWALSLFLIALGCLIQVNRATLPDFLSILLANGFILLGDILLLIGIWKHLGKTVNWTFMMSLFVFFWTPFFFTYDKSEYFQFRTHLMDSVVIILATLCAYYILKEIKKERVSAYVIVLSSFIGITLVTLARSIANITIYLYPETDLTAQDIFACHYAIVMLFFLTLTAGLTMLVSERLRKNLAIALEKERQAIKEQNNFWAMVSHEFKTPLSTIINSASLIELKGAHSPKTIETESLRIQRASKRLSSLVDKCLINDWLDVATTSRQHGALDLVQILQNLSFEYNIKFQNNLPEGTFVQGDPYLLPVAFSSLIDNALKYATHKENCYFSVESQHNNLVAFTVFDDGEEIDDKDLPYLFDKFFRSEKHQAKTGSGYGLYITHKIVGLHNGTIYTQRKDGMTTFTIIFPRGK